MTLADFGTDYTGIGWITLVLPIALLVPDHRLVAPRVATRPDSERSGAGVPTAPAASGKKQRGGGKSSHALLPVLPAFRMLPLGVAIALTLTAVAVWVWHATRRARASGCRPR